jgi:hypothetical protein
MKKALIALAVIAFSVTAFTQDQPKAPAQKQCKDCKDCPKAKQAECKGDQKCACKSDKCPKAKKG